MPVDDAAAVFCEIPLAPHQLAPAYRMENASVRHGVIYWTPWGLF